MFSEKIHIGLPSYFLRNHRASKTRISYGEVLECEVFLYKWSCSQFLKQIDSLKTVEAIDILTKYVKHNDTMTILRLTFAFSCFPH